MRQGETMSPQAAFERIELFEYPAGTDASVRDNGTQAVWNGWMDADEEGGPAPNADQAGNPSPGAASAAFEQRLQEETRRSFAAGREQGCQEERQAHSAGLAAEKIEALERQKREMAALAQSFTLARDRYLYAVEQEVVKLALAVAARVLRREAQMDPLLLTGAVRIALEQLAASTEVRLRVPAAELDLWTEAIALFPNLAVKPVVEPGEGLRRGDCRIETKLGTVDLGIRSQLGEIERGFFDRAGGVRPEPAPAPKESTTAAAVGREPR